MAIVYQKSPGLTDAELHYCPGCHHGIIHKLVAETLVELNLLDSATHCLPWEDMGETVYAETITEAFFKFERAMEWTTFDTKLPDGTSFPQ